MRYVVKFLVLVFYCCDKYQNSSGFKQHKLLVLQFCRSEVLHWSPRAKVKVSPGLCFFRRLQGRFCFLFIQVVGSIWFLVVVGLKSVSLLAASCELIPASKGCIDSLSHGPFLYPQSRQWWVKSLLSFQSLVPQSYLSH